MTLDFEGKGMVWAMSDVESHVEGCVASRTPIWRTEEAH